MVRDDNDLHLALDHTAIAPMARRTLVVEGEAVRFNDPDELAETEA